MCGTNRLRGIDHRVPHDLIVNILEKLPIKSLVRFKCLPMESMVVNRDSTLSYSHTRMFYHFEDYYDMVNSCDGILCFNGRGDICVYNPATKEYRCLPTGLYCRKDRRRLGFGRDLVTDRYKIVKLFNPSLSTAEEDVDSCAVFTLDPNPKACWKTIGVVPYRISAYSHSTYVNGAIYWFTDEIRHLNKSEVIIMFDLHTEKFEPIPHPNRCSDERRSNMQLVTLRECLCLVHQEPDYQLSIWMMQQQKITWEKLYCIQHPDLQNDLRPGGPRFAFAEHKDGTLLVCTRFHVYLYKQNDVIRCVPRKYAEDRYGPCVTTSFTESLVPVYGKTLRHQNTG
ncbi:hypothetical protein V6N13_085086 [Hibiscus sabdariffa]